MLYKTVLYFSAVISIVCAPFIFAFSDLCMGVASNVDNIT